MKIATIVGARPQFIKAAIVSYHMKQQGAVREFIIHTGQHYDPEMSEVFFTQLGIEAPYRDLGVGSGPHGRQTGLMLDRIEAELQVLRPSLVLVYGDTNSTLAGALAAAKLHIPVAHVEAGLRSYNRSMPEEINRVLTDHLSDLLFAPTPIAVRNLAREGIGPPRVQYVGDVMYDASIHFGARFGESTQILERLELVNQQFVLATIHRAENTDHPERMRVIIEALARLSRELPVVVPVHPRTRPAFDAWRIDTTSQHRVALIDPVGYLEMLCLERAARLIVTDSGGVQKEAFFARVPCVTIRDETEWTELVDAGWNRLAPPHSVEDVLGVIIEARRGQPHDPGDLYGGGHAARVIADELARRAT